MTALLLLSSLAIGQDNPWDDLLDDADDLPEEGAPPPAPVPDSTKIEDLDGKKRATRDPGDERFVPQGHRISPLGGGHGIALAEDAVVGGDGGTNVTTLSTRVVYEEYAVSVSLPFAAYRTPEGRTTDLGNLFLEGMYLIEDGDLTHGVGINFHVNPGGQPFTWANEAEELWPGAGANAIYQMRTYLNDETAVLVRGSFGVHSSQSFAPFHQVYPRFGAAAAVDQTVAPSVGIIGETSISYWDISPWSVAGLMRVDPVNGLRARGGILLPMFTWFGASPVDRPGGVREATLIIDLQMAI